MAIGQADELYKILGLTRSAWPHDIKAAYRARVKEVHPDVEGGDRTLFEAVQFAYDVLSDPQLRSRYDADGSVEDPGRIGAARRESLAIVGRFVGEFLEQYLKMPDEARVTGDVIAQMLLFANEKVASIDKEIEEAKRIVRRLEAIKGRFTTKEAGAENVFDKMLDARVRDADHSVTVLTESRGWHVLAVEIIEGHKFRPEEILMLAGIAFPTFVADPTAYTVARQRQQFQGHGKQ